MRFKKWLSRILITDVGTQNELRREEWIAAQLQSIPKQSVLLDAGAGQQHYKRYCSHLKYISQDFCQYTGNEKEDGLQSKDWDTCKIEIVSDITEIPKPDGSFDAILCSEVLEHVPDPINAIREFHRLLKSEGVLIITAPFCSLTHMAPYHYYSGFNKYFYEYHLPNIGFRIDELSANGNYQEFLAQELRRLPSVYPSLPIFVSMLYRSLLRFLGKARSSDNYTRGLLSFGFHVRAKKK